MNRKDDALAAAKIGLFWLCLAAPGAALAQSVQFDPAGSNVILNAVNWLQGTLLGNVATALAVIAVAATGLMMLTGRVDWRRGAVVILGAFVVFGAATIVGGIRSISQGF
ncbi:MAG: TrbC/VIRB2 family protein [Phycisphaerales bacterium]|nr:TrbC/VIRB2 family protein [Hyphomonadaceae bacterium]